MGAQRSDGIPKKQPPRPVVGKPVIHTDVARKLRMRDSSRNPLMVNPAWELRSNHHPISTRMPENARGPRVSLSHSTMTPGLSRMPSVLAGPVVTSGPFVEPGWIHQSK